VLADGFETKNTTVLRPVSVCAPVDKNGEGIGNADDHLVCYDIRDVRGQTRFPRQDVEITNQLDDDSQKLRLTVADTDCVPSRRSATP
jgi:hypothetical protein